MNASPDCEFGVIEDAFQVPQAPESRPEVNRWHKAYVLQDRASATCLGRQRGRVPRSSRMHGSLGYGGTLNGRPRN